MDWIRQIAAIAFVFGLLGGALWWLRRRGMAGWRPAGSSPKMAVIDRLRLTPQHSVHIVRVGKRNFVIAVHTNGCTLLDTLRTEDLEP
jgi:flagellar biosynthetic protein FliO